MLSGSPIKDWIFCTAIGFGLFVLGMAMPLLTLPLMFVYPFPALFLSYTRGLRPAVTSIICSSLLLFLLMSPLFPLIYLVAFGLSGMLMGFFARKIPNSADLLLPAIFSSLVCKLMISMLISHLTGINLLMPDTAQMESTVLALAETGLPILSGEDFSYVKENLAQTINYLVMLIPYSIILFSTAEVAISYFLASCLVGKLGGERFFSLPPFAGWSFPKNILLALLVGFLCELAYSRNPDLLFAKQVGVNLNALARTLFIIQGLAVACFFMERRGFPKFLRVAMIILTPVIMILGDIFSIVGIVDIGFNLRKRFEGE